MTLWKRIYSKRQIFCENTIILKLRVHTFLCIYSDRIEFVSPGALYGSNKLEKLKTASFLEVRNFTIIRILEELDYIENRYSGIPTMKREMEKYGLSAPEFYDERDCFKVILRNNLKDNNK